MVRLIEDSVDLLELFEEFGKYFATPAEDYCSSTEKQIEQIRELARDSEVDVSQQLLQLETLATERQRVCNQIKPNIRICKTVGTTQRCHVGKIVGVRIRDTLE